MNNKNNNKFVIINDEYEYFNSRIINNNPNINNIINTKKSKNNIIQNKKHTNNPNYKCLLCQNMFITNKCIYNNRCLFAHSEEEQVINSTRKYIMDILNDNKNINANLLKNESVYRELLVLTKECEIHKNNSFCKGGNNCNEGYHNLKYSICKDDLIDGMCTNMECKHNHITSKGIHPYNVNKYQNNIIIEGQLLTKKLIEEKFSKYNIPSSDSESDEEIQQIFEEINKLCSEPYEC